LSQSQPPPLNRFSDGFHFTVTTAIILIVCQTATVTLIRFRGISDVRKLVEIEKKDVFGIHYFASILVSVRNQRSGVFVLLYVYNIMRVQ